MSKQKVIDLILSDMRYHFKEAKRYGNRKDKNMTAAAFKNAREDRDKLYEYMTTEEARQLFIAAYKEVFEGKREKDILL